MNPKLNLDFKHLDSIFGVRLKDKVIYLKDESMGSLNTQQLYNWYKEKWSEVAYLSHKVPFEPCGFYGLQPVIKIINGYRIKIPKVKCFTIYGTILCDKPGDSAFILEEETNFVVTPHARPHLKLFLSHSSLDKQFVRKLRSALIPIYETFFDEVDIRPGQSIPQRISVELNTSDYLILIFSINAISSQWVKDEWSAMFQKGKTIIPIILDDTELPALLGHLKYIKYKGDLSYVVSEIANATGTPVVSK